MTYTCCRFPLSVAESAWKEAQKTPQWEQMVEAMKKDHENDKARRQRKEGAIEQQPAATDHVVIPMVETLPGGHIQLPPPSAPVGPGFTSTPFRREDNTDGAAAATSPIEGPASHVESYTVKIARVKAEINNIREEEQTYRACMGGMVVTVDCQKHLDKLQHQIHEREMLVRTYQAMASSPLRDQQATLQRQATAWTWDSPAPSPGTTGAGGFVIPRRGSIRLPLGQLDAEESRYLTPRVSPERPTTPPLPPPPVRSTSVGHYAVPRKNKHI